MTLEPVYLAGLLLAAFLPAILWTITIRQVEGRRREPWSRVARAFVSGGLLGVGAALVLLQGALWFARPMPAAESLLFVTVVAAPLVEEATKPLGLLLFRDADPEPENGYIYGAAAGLGFSAVENVLVEGAVLATGSLGAFVATVALRSVATALLHASATSLVGRAIWAWRYEKAPAILIVPWYAAAVLAHGVFNALAVASTLASLALAIALAAGAWVLVRRAVKRLDAAAA
ncbi:MAG TPA: PrsW family glutamic-type intramembrane protease [Candidatus Thermoplasmatota archaeon]|nr:PrsW family glutamic-type intramembrane protease [Candidatus Thermoplasmatota archaeon]